jgi:hypothetical protein
MAMTVDPAPAPGRSTARERAFVLAGLGIAVAATAVTIAAGFPGEVLGAIWIAAIAWTVAASLAAALRRGLVHRDLSAFSARGPRHAWAPDTRTESFDWSSRTGAFAYLRIQEDRERLLDDGLHGHGI